MTQHSHRLAIFISCWTLACSLCFGQAKQESGPELVGEGTVSTSADEFGGAITPDGSTMYFDVTVPAHYLYIMCESHWNNGRWGKPEVLPFSGQYRDSDPVLTPDGKTLLFASDRPLQRLDTKRFLIWSATKTADGWTKPKALTGPVNSEGSQVFASMARNGNLYFTSSRKSDYYNIYRSRLVNGVYQDAEELAPLNGAGISSLEALIAPDESYILIGSFGRPGGAGNSDVFISYNENGTWTKPVGLGPLIDTPAREYSPRISPDGKWLYLSSERLLEADRKKAHFTHAEFTHMSHGLYNGLGNIYRIPMAYVFEQTRKKSENK
jgi:WD40 repeat protein